MLTAVDKAKLQEMGFDPENLINAIKDAKEVSISIPEGKIYKDADIDELKTNVKASHEKDYSEIYLRKLNKDYDLGLTASDAKDEKRVLQAMKEKAVKDAGVEPDKKVKELELSIKKLQDEVIPTVKKEADEWKSKYSQREEFDFYASLIPKGATSILTKEEHVNRIKGMYKKNEDGTWTDIKAGVVVKDNLEKPITDIAGKITEVYKSNEGWLQAEVAPAKPQFHHSTQGGFGAASAGKFDHAKSWEAVSAKYDTSTREGREMAQQEFTTLQVNAAKQQ